MRAAFGDWPGSFLAPHLTTYPKSTFWALDSLAVMLLPPLIWILWALIFRGGFSLRLMGITLVRANGRKAARWQCAWRALLVWTPVVVLLGASLLVQARFPAWGRLALSLCWLAAVCLVIYLLLGIRFPRRSLHDRLTGTYLVPN
jgi:hypothetical protein